MPPSRPTHKTIAYYCVATHLGGAERSLLELVARVRHLSSDWYEPWVILPQAEGPLVDQLDNLGIPYSVLPMPQGFFSMSRSHPLRSLVSGALAWPSMRSYLARLNQLIDERQPALIHTTGLKCHALSARLGTEVPILWHLRDILDQGTTRLMLRRQRASAGAFLLANSYATATAFEPDDDKPWVVFNGIDTERFVARRDPIFRDRFRIPDDVPVIGAVGVIQRGKGLNHFVDMAATLQASEVEARFVIVGDEIYDTRRDEGFKAELEQRVDELGLSEVFAFVGFHQDSVRVMQGLDLLVSASTTAESFGRVLVEAMACGVPVVATALGGSLEILEDRVCGRLVPPGDVQALAQAAYDLVADEELRERCIEQGRARVLSRFTVDNYVGGVIRAYDRIMRARHSS